MRIVLKTLIQKRVKILLILDQPVPYISSKWQKNNNNNNMYVTIHEIWTKVFPQWGVFKYVPSSSRKLDIRKGDTYLKVENEFFEFFLKDVQFRNCQRICIFKVKYPILSGLITDKVIGLRIGILNKVFTSTHPPAFQKTILNVVFLRDPYFHNIND